MADLPEFLLLPKLAESLTEARIATWCVREGDLVEPGTPIVTVETDKATLDLEVQQPQTLVRILAPEGSVQPVGTRLAQLAPPGSQSLETTWILDLSAIHTHRSRWTGRPPRLEAYLAVAIGRALRSWDPERPCGVGVLSSGLHTVLAEADTLAVPLAEGLLRRSAPPPQPPDLWLCTSDTQPPDGAPHLRIAPDGRAHLRLDRPDTHTFVQLLSREVATFSAFPRV